MTHYKSDWPLLIVAPSSIRGVWIDELEKWLAPCGVSATDFCVPCSGADVSGVATAQVTLVTFALLLQPTLLSALKRQEYQCVIVDESHYLKNRKTKRTQAVLEARSFSRKRKRKRREKEKKANISSVFCFLERDDVGDQ
jgi:SWI/SNF-related matrix-associated actin-dependent regulator 1 of chromatin subfamily A